MNIKNFTTHRLVKGEDLNHHGTLFAGRSAEWFVEAGFIAVANISNPENIVCLRIHGMMFKRPILKGQVVKIDSRIVYAGRTRFTVYVLFTTDDGAEEVVDGFITFINVNSEGRPLPHGITIEAETLGDRLLQEKAQQLVTQKGY